MHCPQCGQQQVSEETKFCSRCGFQLGIVSELLRHGGFLPQLAELNKGKSGYFTRKNGLIFTALWFIFFVMMLPAFFGIARANVLPGISAVFGLFTSIMLLIVSLAFLKRPASPALLTASEFRPVAQAGLYGGANTPALPASEATPAASYMPPEAGWRAPDTGQLQRPGSVTEGTTRLLKKDGEI